MTKTSNTTSGIDLNIFGVYTSKTDGSKGTAYGAGNDQHEANRNSQENYRTGTNMDTSSSGSSGGSGDSGGGCSSGGGCYVTTACLEALGLPKDSLELKAMKTLTKEHILKSFKGKRDYVAYQRRGPAIAQAIDAREDSQNVWKRIYERLQDVSASVVENNYEGAHNLYKDLMLSLEKQFVRA